MNKAAKGDIYINSEISDWLGSGFVQWFTPLSDGELSEVIAKGRCLYLRKLILALLVSTGLSIGGYLLVAFGHGPAWMGGLFWILIVTTWLPLTLAMPVLASAFRTRSHIDDLRPFDNDSLTEDLSLYESAHSRWRTSGVRDNVSLALDGMQLVGRCKFTVGEVNSLHPLRPASDQAAAHMLNDFAKVTRLNPLALRYLSVREYSPSPEAESWFLS